MALKVENESLKRQLLELQLQLVGQPRIEMIEGGDGAAATTEDTTLVEAGVGAEQHQAIQTIPE